MYKANICSVDWTVLRDYTSFSFAFIFEFTLMQCKIEKGGVNLGGHKEYGPKLNCGNRSLTPASIILNTQKVAARQFPAHNVNE